MAELAFIEAYTHCPLCGSSRRAPDFTFDVDDCTIRWERCGDCHLVFQNPRLTEASLTHLYRTTNYFGAKADRNAAYSDYTKADPIRINQSRRRISWITKRSGLSKGRLLDVGSASGFFAVAAREAGFDATCIEPDPDLAEFGRRTYGLRFLSGGQLEACDLQAGHFDLITLWGTDSQFLHPVELYVKLVAALRPGGVLALNYQAFDHWIRKLFPGMKTGWNVIYNHTDRSFDILMERVGLSLVARELEWQTVTVDHACRVLRLKRVPMILRHGTVRLPAISVRIAMARKR